MSEAKLQAQCFQWHWNTYPNERGLLYANYNNPPNAIQGGQLKAMGLVAGVADMTYLTPTGAIFIELKTADGKQSEKQKKWESLVSEIGYKYHVVRTFEEFQKVIEDTRTNRATR